jgi:exosortase/archaeosortase family protein
LGQGKKPEGQTGETRRSSRSFRRDFIQFLILFFALWLFSYLLTRKIPGFLEGIPDPRDPDAVTPGAMQLLVSAELDWVLTHLNYWFDRIGNVFTFHTGHGGEKLVIITECTGIYTKMIYFSIIGAYPARIREKLIGLAIGIPAIHLLNLVRMTVVSLVLFHKREWFGFFHGYFWQVIFVIFMLVLVILWMARIVKPRAEAGAT